MEVNYLRGGQGFRLSSWHICPGLVSQRVPGFQRTELQNALAQVTAHMARIVPLQERLEGSIPTEQDSPQAVGQAPSMGSAAGVRDARGGGGLMQIRGDAQEPLVLWSQLERVTGSRCLVTSG